MMAAFARSVRLSSALELVFLGERLPPAVRRPSFHFVESMLRLVVGMIIVEGSDVVEEIYAMGERGGEKEKEGEG